MKTVTYEPISDWEPYDPEDSLPRCNYHRRLRSSRGAEFWDPCLEYEGEHEHEGLPYPDTYIPVGTPVFDHGNNLPGLIKGRATHLFGDTGTGKTALALMASAAVIKAGGRVLYIDTMCGFLPERAESLGVPYGDPEVFQLFHPESQKMAAEVAFAGASPDIDLIVVDAVGTLLKDGEKLQDIRAVWGSASAHLRFKCKRTNTAVLAIDHFKWEYPGFYGKYTLGGPCWMFGTARRILVDCDREGNPGTFKYAYLKDLFDRRDPSWGPQEGDEPFGWTGTFELPGVGGFKPA